MSKLHLAIDLDDVVLDFYPTILAAFEREFGAPVAFDGDTWGECARAFTEHPAFKGARYRSWWDWLRDRRVWATALPIEGALGGIRTLRTAGHYVECVTSKPEWAEGATWEWLGIWRPAFHRVTVVTTGQRKLDYTSAQVIVDDKLETCREFVAAGRRAIWFYRGPKLVRPWDCLVAHHWADVLTHVGNLQRGGMQDADSS